MCYALKPASGPDVKVPHTFNPRREAKTGVDNNNRTVTETLLGGLVRFLTTSAVPSECIPGPWLFSPDVSSRLRWQALPAVILAVIMVLNSDPPEL